MLKVISLGKDIESRDRKGLFSFSSVDAGILPEKKRAFVHLYGERRDQDPPLSFESDPGQLIDMFKKITAALQRKATRHSRGIRIVVGMHGGIVETMDHDAPGVKIEAIFTEHKKYTEDPDDETWVDKEHFVYTRSNADFDEKHVDRIFAAVGKKGKGGKRGKAKSVADGGKASESAGACTVAA